MSQMSLDAIRVLLQAGNPVSALTQLRKLSASDNAAEYNFLHGVILEQFGDEERAELYIRRSIAENPNFAAAHHHLGVIALRSGNIRASITHLQTAIALAPSSDALRKSAREALARYNQKHGSDSGRARISRYCRCFK